MNTAPFPSERIPRDFRSQRFFTVLSLSLGALIGYLVLSGSKFYLLVALCIPLSGLIFLSNEALILLLLVSHFSLDWLTFQYGLPQKITWIIEGIIGLLFLRTVFQIRSRALAQESSSPWRGVTILLLFSLLSALLNFVPPLSTALGVRLLFRYPLMCWVLLRVPIRKEFPKVVIGLLLSLIFLQVPVSLSQKLFGEGSKTSTGDVASGTLGSQRTHELGLLCIIAICLLAGLYKETREKRYLYFAPLLFIPAAIAEVKAFFVFLPILVLYLFYEDFWRKPGVTLLWSCVIVAVMGGSILLYNSVYTYREKDRFRLYESRERATLQDFLLSPQEILAFETRHTFRRTSANSDRKEPSVGRLQVIALAHEAVRESWLTTVVGNGIGSYTQSSLNDEPEETLLEKVVNKNLIGSTLIELGYGGLLLLAALWWNIYRDNRVWTPQYADPFWRGIGQGFQGIIVLMILSSTYLRSFVAGEQTGFAFWLLFALLTLARPAAPSFPRTVTK